MIVVDGVAALSFLIWVHLVFGRGMFWLARERDEQDQPPEPASWPSVSAVVPARDEADVIARSIGSLLAQDYPGPFRVILVDDDSSDGTADLARSAAKTLGMEERLEVRKGAALLSGWTGKLWAVSQGADYAATLQPSPQYLLLTDADIAHTPDNVRHLVARAEAGGLVLTSLMAKLHCRTWAERTLIPAFVFFFDMLYPFGQVNDPKKTIAAAAGGCMLVRREVLDAQGGIAAIRTAIIDDCALGALMKQRGPIWLGLTERATSLRPYLTFGEIGRMVSRSAYAQLRYSPWLLAGTLLGMALTYLAPPLFALLGTGVSRFAGVGAYVLMTLSFQPMLRFYGRSPLWGLAMPVIGLFYTAFTVKSALDVWSGKGGFWKGRAQAQAGRA